MSDDSRARRNLQPFNGLPLLAEDMYSHLPYVKDIQLCPKEMIRLCSGNLLKFYNISADESVIIDTNDLCDHLVSRGLQVCLKYRAPLEDDGDAVDVSASVRTYATVLTEKLIDQASEEAESDDKEAEEDTQETLEAATESEGSDEADEGPALTNAFADIDDDEDDDDFSFLRAK